MREGVPLDQPERVTGDPIRNFWTHVEKTDTCWLWTGDINRQGYGRIGIGDERFLVHRFAYELLVGPIPDGLTLDHVRQRGCRHRHCVNPDHLEPVTQAENNRRSLHPKAVLGRSGVCQNGHPLVGEGADAHTAPDGTRRCRTCHNAWQREAKRDECPGCGGKKMKAAKSCWPCHAGARRSRGHAA